MKLVFLGTRGYIEPISRLHRMHTSTLVCQSRSRVLIDCGETWRERLSRVSPGAIVITHAHPDHAFGLDRGAPCPVWATRDTWERIDHFPIPDAQRHVILPREPCAIEGIRFEAFPVVHSLRAPAVGYRIRAGAVSVFYVPDVVSIPERRAAFRGIRAYIGDGATVSRNMVRRDRRTGELFGHTTIRAQIAWCREEGVSTMFVTHCGSDIVGGDERRVSAALRVLGREHHVDVVIARDGLEHVFR